METEWEATFWPIDKDAVRASLKAAGATLIHPERLMRRYNFFPPDEEYAKRAWVRVRDEGERITLSVKEGNVQGGIEEQREVQLVIDSMDNARLLLTSLGCREKNYQETRRELWKLDGAEVVIDEWPHLSTLVEVEGIGEDHVRDVSLKLGFAWDRAYFCSVNYLYAEHYGVNSNFLDKQISRLVFEGPNPFV